MFYIKRLTCCVFFDSVDNNRVPQQRYNFIQIYPQPSQQVMQQTQPMMRPVSYQPVERNIPQRPYVSQRNNIYSQYNYQPVFPHTYDHHQSIYQGQVGYAHAMLTTTVKPTQSSSHQKHMQTSSGQKKYHVHMSSQGNTNKDSNFYPNENNTCSRQSSADKNINLQNEAKQSNNIADIKNIKQEEYEKDEDIAYEDILNDGNMDHGSLRTCSSIADFENDGGPTSLDEAIIEDEEHIFDDNEHEEEEPTDMDDYEHIEPYSNSTAIHHRQNESGYEDNHKYLVQNVNALQDEVHGNEVHGNEKIEICEEETADESASMILARSNYGSNILPAEVIEVDKYELTSQTRTENKPSIETVTNRLALRERSKIFRRSEKKWHISVNETAYQMVSRNPKLLQNKKELRLLAESEVRKTYRFAKGKLFYSFLPLYSQ